MKINIVLPFFKREPGGGLKVMYEYANQLQKHGHDVVVYHSSKTKWTHRYQQYFHYLTTLIKWAITKKPTEKRPEWFGLNSNIPSFEIPKVKDKYIREADVIFSTWWATTLEAYKLSPEKGRKHNLIQGYDIYQTCWPELVHKSFSQPINHIVISSYLQPIVAKYSRKTPAVVPNAINHEDFNITTPIQSRNRKKIILLYSQENVKGLIYAIAALKKVHSQFPDIQVIFFCAKNTPPRNLPFSFDFFHKPAGLNSLYNEAAIFVSASIHEGWGLPAMEAMACGCACVCTAIEGHLDFMTDKSNALLVPPTDIDGLSEAIVRLIEDDPLRFQLASQACKTVREFNWTKSTQMLENQFQTYDIK